MKKMYQNWLTFVMVAFLSLGFVACSDSSSSDDGISGSPEEVLSSLEGSWRMEKITANIGGQSMEIPGDQLRQMASGMNYRLWDDVLSFSGNYMNNVPFKLNGSEILLESEPNVYGIKGIKINIKTLTDRTLVLREDLTGFMKDAGVDMSYICDVQYVRLN